ncbi:hypothetical protein MKZ38_005751 [Zalerion maritima]|uniref:BTB domain-containing protein n=1 Tax=Zalerion maritima TaxID=339359 RepID=A0AAD5WQS2_9PEZI|nr:hypothetical protein MKZ38_005751 [Zalerion maritima]
MDPPSSSFNDELTSDLKVEVKDVRPDIERTFAVHKLMLSAKSAFMRAAIEHDPAASTMTIDGDPEAVEKMLSWMYEEDYTVYANRGNNKLVSPLVVHSEINNLAQRYQIHELEKLSRERFKAIFDAGPCGIAELMQLIDRVFIFHPRRLKPILKFEAGTEDEPGARDEPVPQIEEVEPTFEDIVQHHVRSHIKIYASATNPLFKEMCRLVPKFSAELIMGLVEDASLRPAALEKKYCQGNAAHMPECPSVGSDAIVYMIAVGGHIHDPTTDLLIYCRYCSAPFHIAEMHSHNGIKSEAI